MPNLLLVSPRVYNQFRKVCSFGMQPDMYCKTIQYPGLFVNGLTPPDWPTTGYGKFNLTDQWSNWNKNITNDNGVWSQELRGDRNKATRS